MRNPVICIVLTALAAAIPGCINADPSTFPSVDAGVRPDVVVTDAEGDTDPHAACRACLDAPEDPGPGCAGAVAAVMTDPQAVIIYECGFRLGCWSLTNQGDIVSCGFPCFTEAGIKTFTEPAIELTTGVMMCVLGVCQPACGANP